MDFDLPPSFPASGIAWERVLPPLLPGQNGTFGLYSFTPSELLTPVTEHTGPAQPENEHSSLTVFTINFNRRYRIPEGVDSMGENSRHLSHSES
uniref:Uncharacterized protein n=1 Tax=Oncorhynchus mykiss TaxID=8022 RepID=A0A8C7VZD8_ONCMY